MTFKPFFPWCCDQELATCDICDRPVPTCLRVTIYDCENDYEYGTGDCDCTTFGGTYFLRGVQHVSRLYLRDPGGRCGENYFETQNACIWWGYVCNPVKRCGPEPCEVYDRIAVVLGPRIGGYDYGPIGYWSWIVFYDSQDAPHGLPGIPSKRDMLGTQLVIDGAWQFDETETGIVCDDFTRSCGGQRETSCVAGGGHCIDLSTCRFACRVRIEALECDQAALACNSFPCESCCRGTHPNAVTVTLLNPPSELACLEGWPHNVPLYNDPNCTTPCVYKGEFLCYHIYGYGYDKDGHIEVTVTRDTRHGLISVDAYFRGARYRKVVDDSCESLSLLDLDYVSGKVDGNIDVSGTKLRVEANAGGVDVTADGFVGFCDQVCQPPHLLVTVDGFVDYQEQFPPYPRFEFSKFNGDYVVNAGGALDAGHQGVPTRCTAYGTYLRHNEPLNSFCVWQETGIWLLRLSHWSGVRFIWWNDGQKRFEGIDVVFALSTIHPMPWDCDDLDLLIETTFVYWYGYLVNWPITVRIRKLP